MAFVQVTCPPKNHLLFGPGGIDKITPGAKRKAAATTIPVV